MNKTIIIKFGNWKIDIIENKIRISDGWYADWPIFYNEKEFAVDNPYKLPKSILNYLYKNTEKLYNIQNLFRKYRINN